MNRQEARRTAFRLLELQVAVIDAAGKDPDAAQNGLKAIQLAAIAISGEVARNGFVERNVFLLWCGVDTTRSKSPATRRAPVDTAMIVRRYIAAQEETEDRSMDVVTSGAKRRRGQKAPDRLHKVNAKTQAAHAVKMQRRDSAFNDPAIVELDQDPEDMPEPGDANSENGEG